MDERLHSTSNDILLFRLWSLQVSTIMHHAVAHETEGQARLATTNDLDPRSAGRRCAGLRLGRANPDPEGVASEPSR